MSFAPDLQARLAALAERYPTRRAALLPALWAIQEERGWVSRADLAELAGLLGLAPADAEGVASFYFLFRRAPGGRTVVDVCDNVICQANGAEALLADLCGRLGIRPGETTADGRVTVRRQECLAACHQAPAAQVDLEYVGPATAELLLARIGAAAVRQ